MTRRIVSPRANHCNMAGRTAPPSCQSSERHDDNITNLLYHFTGCIEIRERENFLNGNVSIWEREMIHQSKVLGHPDADERVNKMKSDWKITMESEMRRISLLRKTFNQSKNDRDKRCVREVDKSGKAWRKQRNKSHLPPDQIPVLGPDFPSAENDYELEDDISTPVIQFKNGTGFTDPDERFGEVRFPNQKTTVKTLLYSSSESSSSLLLKDEKLDSKHIKYFHIPSNNMDVSNS